MLTLRNALMSFCTALTLNTHFFSLVSRTHGSLNVHGGAKKNGAKKKEKKQEKDTHNHHATKEKEPWVSALDAAISGHGYGGVQEPLRPSKPPHRPQSVPV